MLCDNSGDDMSSTVLYLFFVCVNNEIYLKSIFLRMLCDFGKFAHMY